jgi:tetratricopeptide (TPR) repeat protein
MIPGMRIAAAAFAASLAFVFAPSVWALENAPIENLGSGKADTPPATHQQKLDALFATLESGDEAAAKRAENGILTLWLQSGSDTIDLLMSWGMKAIEDKDYGTALDVLDRVVTLKPDYAEGWNKRATVYYLTDKYGQSLADIQRVLVLEPRHFGALSGLGSIFRELGDDKRAIDAYNQALALDPHLENVKKALDELDKENAGHDI